MTKHARSIAFLFPLLVTASLGMAQTVGSVNISSNPAGAAFLVDGYSYVGSQTFLWPYGSKHTLQFSAAVDASGIPQNYQQSGDGLTRYVFNGWTLSNGDNQQSTAGITVTAGPALTSIVMGVSKTVRLQVRFSSYPPTIPGNCFTNSAPQDAVRVGVVVVNGTCMGSDTDLFVSTGTVTVGAYPFAGFVFTGWATNAGPTVSTVGSMNITGPATIVAQFQLAKRVTFRTKPLGLNVLVDRTPTPTIDPTGYDPTSGTCPFNLGLPNAATVTISGLCYGDFDFVPGSSHVLGAPSPQYDKTGNLWVIDSFSNGVQPNGIYVAPTDLSTHDTIVANFVPGDQVSFVTNPSGLKLNIDGRSNWLSYNFAWGQGTTHTVSAADQTDAHNRRWVFRGWSNAGAPTQTITVNGPTRLIASFDVLPQVIVQSTPPGVTVSVDGADCPTPCILDRPAGSNATITAPTTVPLTDLSRMEFTGWPDGSPAARVIAFNADQQTITAQYQTTFKLAASGDPSTGASFAFNPPSANTFFAENSVVTVTATAKNGYKFRRWDGDLSGTYNQGTLAMTSPHQVMALLDKVPFIGPAGIHSAAGITPDGTVAPGSLISITGESLAQAYVAGATTPLSQGLGGVTVTVNSRLLPLVYVSPQEIRAQLYSDFPDGDYTALIQSQGMPDVSGNFTVARNSPGLFPAPNQDLTALNGALPVAWATHNDGTAVTTDSPATQGETITLYGTGFGPVDGFTLDGFPVPASASYKLKDVLQVTAGSVTLDPDWVGATAGQIGIQSVRFTISPDMPTATVVPVSVTVNGKTSNAVNLALQ